MESNLDIIRMLDTVHSKTMDIIRENEALKSYLLIIDTVCGLEKDKETALEEIRQLVSSAKKILEQGELK